MVRRGTGSCRRLREHEQKMEQMEQSEQAQCTDASSSLCSLSLRASRCPFSLWQSIGFIGGRPRHSYYFVGVRGYSTYYLDPHVTQQHVPMKRSVCCSSFHCNSPEKMSLAHIDPSLGTTFTPALTFTPLNPNPSVPFRACETRGGDT